MYTICSVCYSGGWARSARTLFLDNLVAVPKHQTGQALGNDRPRTCQENVNLPVSLRSPLSQVFGRSLLATSARKTRVPTCHFPPHPKPIAAPASAPSKNSRAARPPQTPRRKAVRPDRPIDLTPLGCEPSQPASPANTAIAATPVL